MWDENARGVGDGVERLPIFTDRSRGVLVTNPSVQAQVLINTPRIVGKEIDRLLVAVISACTSAALAEIIGRKVFQVNLRSVVLVVPARSLRKLLGRNVPAVLSAKLEVVLTSYDADVVDELIEVLNLKLPAPMFSSKRLKPTLNSLVTFGVKV